MTLKDDGLSEGRGGPWLTGAACIFPLDGFPLLRACLPQGVYEVWNANVGLTAPSSAYAETQTRATTYHLLSL